MGVLHAGVGRLQGDGVGHAKPTLRRCGDLLLEFLQFAVDENQQQILSVVRLQLYMGDEH